MKELNEQGIFVARAHVDTYAYIYKYKIYRYTAKIVPGTRTPSLRRDKFEDDVSFDLSEDMIKVLSVGIVIDFPQRTIYQRINWLWTLKCVFCGFYISMGLLKKKTSFPELLLRIPEKKQKYFRQTAWLLVNA